MLQARGTVAFLNDQLDTLGQQLHGYEQTLQNYREGAGIVSLDAEGEAQVKRLADFQAQRDLADAERSSLAKALNDIEHAPHKADQPSPYRRLLGFPSILASGAAVEVLRSLNEAENQRAELLQRRTADDPDVLVWTNRINDMETQLHDLVTTNLTGLSNRIASLDGILAQFAGDLKKIPAKEIELADAIGCRAVLYAGGHQHRPLLEASGAVVVESFAELEAWIAADNRAES